MSGWAVGTSPTKRDVVVPWVEFNVGVIQIITSRKSYGMFVHTSNTCSVSCRQVEKKHGGSEAKNK